MHNAAPSFSDEPPQTLRALILTEGQAAEFLNLKKKTLQAWRVRGGGPPFLKLGRAVRYRISDLENFLNERVHESTSDQGPRLRLRGITL